MRISPRAIPGGSNIFIHFLPALRYRDDMTCKMHAFVLKFDVAVRSAMHPGWPLGCKAGLRTPWEAYTIIGMP